MVENMIYSYQIGILKNCNASVGILFVHDINIIVSVGIWFVYDINIIVSLCSIV